MAIDMTQVIKRTFDNTRYIVQEWQGNVKLWEEATFERTASGNGLVEFNGNRNCGLESAVFEGACSQDGTPTPTNPIPVKCNNSKWVATGKNIYTGSNIVKQAGVGYTTIYCNLKKGITYTISGEIEVDNTSITKCLLVNGQNTSEQFGYISVGSNKHLTFTPQKNCTSIFFYAGTSYGTSSPNTGTFRNIQIELGSIATSYVPYFSGGTVDLSSIVLRGVNTVKDEFEAISGKLTRRFGVVDLGTLTWSYNSCFVADKSDVKTGASGFGNILCPKYLKQNSTYRDSLTDKHIMITISRKQIAIRDSDYASTQISEFKASLNGVYLIYELATPTESTITPQPISQILGDNEIRQISGDIENTPLEVTYYGR